jgi:hypothetical protein
MADLLLDPVNAINSVTSNLINNASQYPIESLVSVTNNFVTAAMNSLFMILVTEIGDKTFFIAAILAMRHGRLVVYAGAMGKEVQMKMIVTLFSQDNDKIMY